MKPTRVNIFFVLLGIIGISCLFIPLGYYFNRQYSDRPERQLCEQHLRDDLTVRSLVGAVSSISFDNNYSGWVFVVNNRDTEGRYCFHVAGSNGAERIVLDWTLSRNGEFTVDAIGVVRGGRTVFLEGEAHPRR